MDNPDSVILLGHDGPGSIVQGTMDKLKRETSLSDLISESFKDENDSRSASSNAKSERTGSASSGDVGKVDDAEADMLRKSGDLSLYRYYLSAVGWSGLVGFFITGLLSAVWPGLPRESWC